jgi:hypothetical protein
VLSGRLRKPSGTANTEGCNSSLSVLGRSGFAARRRTGHHCRFLVNRENRRWRPGRLRGEDSEGGGRGGGRGGGWKSCKVMERLTKLL